MRALALTIAVCLVQPAWTRQDSAPCGSSRETLNESLFRHRQFTRARGVQPRVATAAALNRDAGDIAIMQDAGGIVQRQNQFNLDGATLTFTPAAGRYRYAVSQQGYDAAAAAAGAPLVALDDDDTRPVPLPFAFPFFGRTYREVYVNSDGNLTFTASDTASSQRSLGRMTAGPPRISPLFDDLNPSQTAGGVRVLSEATRAVVSWVNVPEYADFGRGVAQTFQARLYADGRIEFSYSGVAPSSAVVGIAPGNLQPGTALVDYLTDSSATYQAGVAEIFGNTLTLDVVSVAQQFYLTHEDSYDYLAIYNNMGIGALGEGTIAYEETVRNTGTGFGVPVADAGQQFGSASRLQSVLNLGPLSQYPADPNSLVLPRAAQADTPLTILTHEAGHRFLAYASIKGASDPSALPMLGFQLAHWSFLFNSEASVMEGERIADRGTTATPQFLTTDITQAYAPLDQYLMGFREPSEVADVFVVNNPTPAFTAAQHQFSGVAFSGTRQNIKVDDVIAAEGRRVPDSTVSQHRFRFAFILVVAQGSEPTAAEISKLDGFRQQFEAFYAKASSGRATANTALRRSLKLSLYPASGMVVGRTARATVAIETPRATDLAIQISAANGNVQFPATVTIPAGSVSASFSSEGVKAGVEDVQAVAAEACYEAAAARVQVADHSQLKLVQVPGATAVRLTDANDLPYPGAGIVATPSAGGAVVPSEALTDANGVASFQWNPGSEAVNHLTLAVDGQPGASITLDAGSAVPVITSVVNAASLAPGIAPGSLQLINGSHLTTARITAGGLVMSPFYGSDTQILFVVPQTMPLGKTALTIETANGSKASAAVEVAAAAPGIFSGGVVLVAGYLEIYCTGLGVSGVAPTVFIGATPIQPVYSGPAPNLPGASQVNVQIPAGISGTQQVVLSLASAHSNPVNIVVK
jgi:uncharacterized protein (TIGR03437 family)